MGFTDPVDESGSDQPVDEAALVPLAESRGVVEDDPDDDFAVDAQPYAPPDVMDDGEARPDEVPAGLRLGDRPDFLLGGLDA